jgi:hypothetical protein
MGLFGTDRAVRHLQQLEYNLIVGAMDKTHLLERVIDAACTGPKRQKVPQQRSQAEALGCTMVEIKLYGKYGNNNTNELQYSTNLKQR